MDVANRDTTAIVCDKNLFKENGRQLQTEDVYEIKLEKGEQGSKIKLVGMSARENITIVKMSDK